MVDTQAKNGSFRIAYQHEAHNPAFILSHGSTGHGVISGTDLSKLTHKRAVSSKKLRASKKKVLKPTGMVRSAIEAANQPQHLRQIYQKQNTGVPVQSYTSNGYIDVENRMGSGISPLHQQMQLPNSN